jgi:thiamine-phosphate pyrophosphorylase
VCPLLPIHKPLLCYVTDRLSLGGAPELSLKRQLDKIGHAAQAGVDWIQLREKDLSGREMVKLTESAIQRAGKGCAVLVNDRVDVACATSAHGVHLGERSLSADQARRLVSERCRKDNFFLGVSAHSIEGAMLAQQAGADYLIFGPVYATPSKASFGQPQGVSRLREVCQQSQIPVLAIGGITLENAGECFAAGARGIAAIRLFQAAEDLGAVVSELRRLSQ